MAIFDIALKIVLQHEGGYSNDPVDKGGETYKGISRIFAPAWKGWAIIDFYKKDFGLKSNAVIKSVELDNLVGSFYYTNKWLPSKAGGINSQPLANFVFDMYTNHGRAALLVNKAVNQAAGKAIVAEKNVMTTATIAAINANASKVYSQLINIRTDYFKSLDTFWKFGKGWLARIKKFPSTIEDFLPTAFTEASTKKKKIIIAGSIIIVVFILIIFYDKLKRL